MSANVLELIVHMRAGSGPTVNPAFTAVINAYKNSSFITFWEDAIANAPPAAQPPEPSDPVDPNDPVDPGPNAASDIEAIRTLFPALFDWNAAHNEKYTATIARWQNEIFAQGDMSGFAMHAGFARAFTNKSLQMMTELEDSKLVIADTYSEAFNNKGDVLSKGIPSLTSNSAALAADLARYGTYGSGIHMREWHTLRGVLQELDYRELLPYLSLTGIDLSTATDTEIAGRFDQVTAEQLRTVKQVFEIDSSVELRNLADLTRATHVFATSNSSNTFSTLQEFSESLSAIGNFDGVKHWSALAEYIASVEIVVDSSPTLSDPATEAGITSMYGFGTGPRNSVTMEDLFGILTGEKYIPIIAAVNTGLAAIDTSNLESAINTVLEKADAIDLDDQQTIDEYDAAVVAMQSATTAINNASLNLEMNNINTLISAERARVAQSEIDLSLYTLNPNNRDLIVGFAESLPNLQPDSDVFVFLQKLADPATPAGRVYANTLNEAVVTQAQRENNVR